MLTLPALAMKIYKILFMPKDTVYQLHGKIEQNIRESYTGGAVDVYIPHNRITSWLTNDNVQYETLYLYDVNSLYPYVMSQQLMPIGKPIAFEGNIRNIEPDAYGIFYCEILSPTFLEHPILQRRIKTSNGLRTVAGLGTWTTWINSAEMDNAIKFGYQFNIIKGYKFETTNIFYKYISKLYDLRLHFSKVHLMNLIAKLLMNSLYGKFGMKDDITIMEILRNVTPEDKALVSSFLDAYSTLITDILNLEDHTLLIRKATSDLEYNQKEDYYHGTDINIVIASAITAGARIHMSQFKNNPDLKLYYSDTDSIVTNAPLPQELVGNKLGQVKLEYVITKAVFLAPKVYALITDEGKEIIKIKGVTHDVISKLTFNDIEALLIKDSSREFTQEKWTKSITKGTITVNDIVYTLKARIYSPDTVKI